jgi:AraC-like DNA-binding protein
VALFILLPRIQELKRMDALHELMARCRPHSILPYVEEVEPEELISVLRRFPNDFAVEVTEYLTWRGFDVDLDTRRLLRKTFELSGELRTVSALARALYMSRRALGRRFLARGLPVPSHWLHFGRILRGSIRLQDPNSNLFSIGCSLGYPDGFAFSNQMKRLTGLRPSIMRECFGWEWIVESWLQQEARNGHLSTSLAERLFADARAETHLPSSMAAASQSQGRSASLRVSEDRRGMNLHHPSVDDGSNSGS